MREGESWAHYAGRMSARGSVAALGGAIFIFIGGLSLPMVDARLSALTLKQALGASVIITIAATYAAMLRDILFGDGGND